MKVAPVLATALVICIAIPGSNQGKGKTKFCTGADGNRYKKGESYEDEEACLRYTCIKSRNKFKMKKEKIKPCPKPEIEQNLAANVTSLESKLQALQESVQSLQTSMDSMQGMMATIQSTSSKLETNISSSMDAINTNKKSITKNEGLISVNKDTISTNNAALAAKNTQIEMNITSAMEAISTNKESISTNNAKDIQMEMNITSAMEAINTNKESISTNNAAFAAKDTQMESCFADISSSDCPSPASGKTSVAGGISSNTAALDDIQEAIAELQKDVNIVVTGGHFGGNLKTSEIISPGGVCSQGIPPLPVGVRHHQSVYFNKSLMVCGGYGDNGNQKRCHQLRNSNSQWTEGPAMNIGRHHFSMTKAGQDLYALGGSTAAGYTDSMEKLSGSSGEWTLMDQKLTSVRAFHCTVFMKTTNSLVTIGGRSSTMEEFNLSTLTWKQLASLPMSLHSHACVALDQSIMVIGGNGGGAQKKVYQFSGGNWQTTGDLEIARQYHTAGIIDNKIIVIGGLEDKDGIEEIKDDGNFKKLQKKLSKKIAYHASTEVPRNDFTCS